MMDARELRNALGWFPTGVAVIATRAATDVLIGLTANSVVPVSAWPPRLLWSLASRSRSREAFEASEHFTVSLLSDTQIGVAKQMSSPAIDRFAGLDWQPAGASGLPVFRGCIAWFECRRHSVIEIGDHVVFVGDVVGAAEHEGSPLLYAAGAYAQLAPARGEPVPA